MRLSLVLDGGPCQVGIESTIVDMSGERTTVLRPGMLAGFDIGLLLGRMPAEAVNTNSVQDAGLAPGPLRAAHAAAADARGQRRHRRAYQPLAKRNASPCWHPFPAPIEHPLIVYWHIASTDADTYARELYATLRALDAAGADLIIVQRPPWPAVIDRLMRASAGSGP